MDDCGHETIILNRCLKCKIPMREAVHVKGGASATLPNLSRYDIPGDVRGMALDLYTTKMHVDFKRGTKRRELDFFLIYSAYKELGILTEPLPVAMEVGIGPNSIGKAHATFCFGTTGYKPPIVIGYAPDLVPRFCQALGYSDTQVVRAIQDLAETTIERNKTLRDHSPQKLAAAFIQVYFDRQDYQLDRKHLCEMVNVTEGTLGAVVKTVRGMLPESVRVKPK